MLKIYHIYVFNVKSFFGKFAIKYDFLASLYFSFARGRNLRGGGITKTLVNDTILTMIYDFSDVEIVHVRLSAKFAENTQKKSTNAKSVPFFIIGSITSIALSLCSLFSFCNLRDGSHQARHVLYVRRHDDFRGLSVGGFFHRLKAAEL